MKKLFWMFKTWKWKYCICCFWNMIFKFLSNGWAIRAGGSTVTLSILNLLRDERIVFLNSTHFWIYVTTFRSNTVEDVLTFSFCGFVNLLFCGVLRGQTYVYQWNLDVVSWLVVFKFQRLILRRLFYLLVRKIEMKFTSDWSCGHNYSC